MILGVALIPVKVYLTVIQKLHEVLVGLNKETRTATLYNSEGDPIEITIEDHLFASTSELIEGCLAGIED